MTEMNGNEKFFNLWQDEAVGHINDTGGFESALGSSDVNVSLRIS